jgi:hypothetical protein
LDHEIFAIIRNRPGIALGPILFIIAILVIIAGAIAVGAGGFHGSTSTESAKSNAETIINTAHSYNDALQLVLHNGCNEAQLDWTPNGGGYPAGATTWTSADYSVNGTGHTGSGQCAMFDPRGGGLIFKKFPSTALASPSTGAYTSQVDGGINEDAFAGYPVIFGTSCINGLGTCPLGGALGNASILMFVPYVNYAVCQQINKLLNLSLDPQSTFLSAGYGVTSYQFNIFYYEALAKLRARPEFFRFLVVFECARPADGRFPIC